MKIIITESQYELLKEQKNDESILIVGDSHTVDAGFTWSSKMKNKFNNVKIIAVGGKRTDWMKEQLKAELSNKKYDKVIIWGGNNDTFSLTPNSKAISNIQDMVDIVNSQGGKPYVVQGYDYEIFADPNKYKPTKYATKEDMKKFRQKYIDFQNELASSISGAVIIPKFNVDNSHAPDNIHGDSSAHNEVLSQVSKAIQGDFSPNSKNIVSGENILERIKNYISDNKNFKFSDNQSPIYQKEVEDLQIALQFLGFSLPKWGVDGKFGPETKKAVIEFQKSSDLDLTGKFEKEDLQKLYSTLKDKNFEESDLSKIEKTKSENFRSSSDMVINNPGVSLVKYPSNLMEKFREIAGDDYDEFISGCNSIGLNPEIAVRQLYTESGFSPNVINCSRKSVAGAMGIAQFMPDTWKSYGIGSPCNVSDSLKAYIKLMGDNLKRFPGRPDIAVAAYNSGPNLKAYSNALKNELDFTDLKGRIPNESYKYSASIFQA